MLDGHHSLDVLSQNSEILVGVFMIVFWVNNGLNQVVEDEEVRDADFIASKELLLSKFFLCFELYRFNEFAVLVGYFFSSQKRALRMHDHDLFN